MLWAVIALICSWVQPASARLEFPTGYGRQQYWIGRPILPEELASLRYADRARAMLDTLNALGPGVAHETPADPDPAFAQRVAQWMQRSGAAHEDAVIYAALTECADPGPASYDSGSLIPALTDAFLVCGLLEPDQRLGGKLPLRMVPARAALSRIADSLGSSVEEVADGAIRIAIAMMTAEASHVLARRGVDAPRFRMVAPNGNMEDPSFADLIYDSNLSTVKVRASGVLTFTVGTGCYGQQHVVNWPDFGFIPFVLLGIYHPVGLYTYGPRTNGSRPIEIGSNSLLGYAGTDNVGYQVKCGMPNMFYDQSNLQGGTPSFPGGTGTTICTGRAG